MLSGYVCCEIYSLRIHSRMNRIYIMHQTDEVRSKLIKDDVQLPSKDSFAPMLIALIRVLCNFQIMTIIYLNSLRHSSVMVMMKLHSLEAKSSCQTHSFPINFSPALKRNLSLLWDLNVISQHKVGCRAFLRLSLGTK